MDYALWKVERHSGVRVEVAPRQRRWPLLRRAMAVLEAQAARRTEIVTASRRGGTRPRRGRNHR